MVRILVIEDDVDITKVLKKRLTDNGYEALIANDMTEGLRLAKFEKPDLMILDMMLPVGGGLSLLRTFKKSTDTKDIPIIIVTGVQSETVKANAMREGAAAYVRKPYDMQQLLKCISETLNEASKNG